MPSNWKWHGRRVMLFDGTTVSMPDTPDNQAAFPQSPEQKPGLGFPVARLGGLIGLSSGAVVGYAVAPCSGKGSGEQSLLHDLLCLLQAGDFLLADALLATWWLVAGAVRRGADVVMPQHGSRHTDFTQGKQLGNRDHVVTWRKPPRPARMSPEEYLDWPDALSMREFEVRGRVLVTTLLDPSVASPQELDALYCLRWMAHHQGNDGDGRVALPHPGYDREGNWRTPACLKYGALEHRNGGLSGRSAALHL